MLLVCETWWSRRHSDLSAGAERSAQLVSLQGVSNGCIARELPFPPLFSGIVGKLSLAYLLLSRRRTTEKVPRRPAVGVQDTARIQASKSMTGTRVSWLGEEELWQE